MNSKKLITLLVLTTMLFAMVPMVPVANAVLVSGNIDFVNQKVTYVLEDDKAGEKGHTIECHGWSESVASGYEVSVYWDKIQAWDGVKGHLNTTEVDDDGGFEIWLDVPQSPEGYHYLWFTATDQETKVQVKFRVVTDTDISTSSGLAGAKILVDLWGYDNNEDVVIVFAEDGDAHNWGTVTAANDVLYTYTATDTKVVFTGLKFRYSPVARSLTTPIIYHHSGATVTQIAHWNGAAWVADTGLFISATLTDTTGLMTLTLLNALTAGDTIEVDYTAASPASVKNDEDQDETTNAEDKKYDGQTSTGMIIPKTFSLQYGSGGPDIANDINGDGKLAGAGVTSGSIDYVTGEWSITFAAAPGVQSLFADYVCVKTITNYVHVLTTTVTNDVGTIEDRRVTIPSGAAEGVYKIVGFDGDSSNATAAFTIGSVITLSTDEGDVGDKIEITGEGFPANTEVICQLVRGTSTPLCHIIGAAGTGVGEDVTNGDGEFEFDIIIPGATKKDDDYKILVTAGTYTADASFEVTGLADINIDPDFGPQGSKITVSGSNFPNIKDSKVDITLVNKDTGAWIVDIKKGVKTDADGTFSATCTVPTENDASYKIKATSVADTDGEFGISDKVEFRIGTIMVLLSDDEGVVGKKIVLTGNGFTETGEWNATFGGVTIFEDETCVGGLLKAGGVTPEFFVPQLQPGEYTILVWDVDAEISVETDFTVTEYTVLDFELLDAPNEFNVSISGWNWPEVIPGGLNEEDEITFVLWNETDEWDMEVIQYGPHVTGTDKKNPDDRNRDTAVLNGTGFFNDAWWIVPKDETLSKGKYWVNATIETDNDQEYFMQFEFVVGDIHMYSAPRKATFRITETVSFKIQHTFGNDKAQDIWSGDIKVYDPDGTLYWDGDPLNTWSKVGTWYECPTSSQTASSNPMILLDDAPLGTWTYKWRDKTGEVIAEGVFNVESSEADILGGQIDDLNQAINDLTDDITGVTEAVAGVQSNVNSAIQAANAAVAAANAAVDAVNAVAGVAGDAAEAANRAAESAGKAQDAASGLTTLVYGAIGASLVAALAAIVSLMQISRRIAG